MSQYQWWLINKLNVTCSLCSALFSIVFHLQFRLHCHMIFVFIQWSPASHPIDSFRIPQSHQHEFCLQVLILTVKVLRRSQYSQLEQRQLRVGTGPSRVNPRQPWDYWQLLELSDIWQVSRKDGLGVAQAPASPWFLKPHRNRK